MENFKSWILFIDNKFEQDEKKHKWLNLIRILILIGLISCFSLYRSRVNSLFSLYAYIKESNWGYYLALLIVLYGLIVLYKDWIKKLWNFFAKDKIMHYFFLGLIPVFIIFGSYHFFYEKQDSDKFVIIKKTTTETGADVAGIKAEYDEIIDRLTGFYAALFTAVAVVGALLGLSTYRGIREMKDKLEKFKSMEEQVSFLGQKNELAKWAQEKFDTDDAKKIISSFSLEMEGDEDEEKSKKICANVYDDSTDDSWLRVIVAHQLLSGAESKRGTLQEKRIVYSRVVKIFKYIENRDLLNGDSNIELLLYHLWGQLYWRWYKDEKKEFTKEIESKSKSRGISKDSFWKCWWEKQANCKQCYRFDRFKTPGQKRKKSQVFLHNSKPKITKTFRKPNPSDATEQETKPITSCWWEKNSKEYKKSISQEHRSCELLNMSKKYYERVLSVGDKKDIQLDETWGNLGVVLIEMSKFKKLGKENIEKLLTDAEGYLKKIDDKNFNTFWDLARVEFYINPKLPGEKIKKELEQAAKMIESRKDKNFFLKMLKEEQEERLLDNRISFPGRENKKIIGYIEKIFENKRLT